MSNADKVKEFTELSLDKSVPNKPRPMNKDEVKFLIRMCCSELVELAQTVCENSDEAVNLVKNSANTDLKPNYQAPKDTTELIAHQADALVDCWYYGLNGFCKVGVNLSKVFDVVHDANMAKRFPDGKFHRREDGKIIKPPEWHEPNINQEIQNQIDQGTWSNKN